MKSYWLAVMGNVTDMDNLEKGAWWCLPRQTQIGDLVLMYCPRSVRIIGHGIFAECEVVTEPITSSRENWRCSGYSGRHGQAPNLGYTELALLRRFKTPLAAKDIKSDPMLKELGFVRRNFQGTTFSVSDIAYERIISLSKSKEYT